MLETFQKENIIYTMLLFSRNQEVIFRMEYYCKHKKNCMTTVYIISTK